MKASSNATAFWGGSALVAVLVTAVLYFAQAVFIPLALALLLSFLLAPLVRGLERRRIPAGMGVALSLLLSLVVIGGIATIVSIQAIDLAEKLPTYREQVASKVEALRGEAEGLERLAQALDVFESPRARAQRAKPVRVEIVETRLQWFGSLVGPLLGPITTAGLVIVFAIFMLLQWDDLRDRMLRLSGQGRLSLTTQALEEASRRVSHYLQMQLLINALVGVAIGVGLWVIGVPNAPLWGLLSLALRFIPYAGPWIAAAFPILVSFATNDGWTPMIFTFGLFVVVEVTASHVLEPWLYGSRTGLSPIGVMISFVFWGWMWGGVGMLLATPLTVCLVVAARYIPQLETIGIILSDQRALAPWARLYHRLLAFDPDEAAGIVAHAKKETRSLAEFYDTVLGPVLYLAERDRQAEELSGERRRIVYASLRNFVEEERPRPTDGGEGRGIEVVCVGADSVSDHISAVMAAQVLVGSGVSAEAMPENDDVSSIIEYVAVRKPAAVLLAAVPPTATVNAQVRCRKIRDLFPELPIVVGVWSAAGEVSPAAGRLRSAGADRVVETFGRLPEAVGLAITEHTPRPRPLSVHARHDSQTH